MRYKMIVLDLDGTLTNSKKEISKATKHALMNIQKKGVRVVLASGRPTAGVLPLAEELELKKYGGYVLSYNGANIMECETGRFIYNKVLPQKRLPEIYEEVKKLGTSIISYEDDHIISANGVNEYIELESRINSMPIREIENFDTYIDFPVNKCLLGAEPEEILVAEEVLKDKFGGELNIYRSESFFLEIVPQNIDKAYSLTWLLDRLGFTREEMICCGDGYNDLSMIKLAGLGVAMENAQEAVKAQADFITYSNDKDGIVHVIERFIMGNAGQEAVNA